MEAGRACGKDIIRLHAPIAEVMTRMHVLLALFVAGMRCAAGSRSLHADTTATAGAPAPAASGNAAGASTSPAPAPAPARLNTTLKAELNIIQAIANVPSKIRPDCMTVDAANRARVA